MIPVAKLVTKEKPYDKIPMIAYFESELGLGFVPTEYVDITDTIETKMAMCREHKSQVQWMSDNYKDALSGKDFLDDFYTIARYRGIQCGVQFAEGFQMAHNAYRVAPYRILP